MIRNSTNEITIKPRASTSSKLIIAIIALLALIILVYFTYDFGKRSGGNQYTQDAVLIKQLNSTIEKQDADILKSQEQMIFAERQKQIQEEAYKQMSLAYASSEQKNRYLGSRLDFIGVLYPLKVANLDLLFKRLSIDTKIVINSLLTLH